MPEPEISYQCRHIFPEGRRCGSPCLRGEDFCFYHHTSRPAPLATIIHRRRRRARRIPFPTLDNRAAIQLALGQILNRLAAEDLDHRRAGLLLYGLQIATLNLPRHPQPQPAATPEPLIEDIVQHPTHGALAPTAQLQRPQPAPSLFQAIVADWENQPSHISSRSADCFSFRSEAEESASPVPPPGSTSTPSPDPTQALFVIPKESASPVPPPHQ